MKMINKCKLSGCKTGVGVDRINSKVYHMNEQILLSVKINQKVYFPTRYPRVKIEVWLSSQFNVLF